MGIPPDVDGILGLAMGGEMDLAHFDVNEEEAEEWMDDFVAAPLFVDGLFNGEKIG